jgi:hypothetical protein
VLRPAGAGAGGGDERRDRAEYEDDTEDARVPTPLDHATSLSAQRQTREFPGPVGEGRSPTDLKLAIGNS